MSLEVRKKQRENIQNLVRRFQKAMQASGILLQVRKNQFIKRAKSKNMKKKSALRRIEVKKHYEALRKLKRI